MLRNSRSHRLVRGAAAALAVVLALAGCGGTGQPGDSASKSGVLKYGDDFAAVGFITDPIEFRGNSRARVWMDLIYDTMFYEAEDGIKPGLALKAAYPDDSTIVLTLRENVTFHDGTPFDAEAVKFSWDRFIATGDERATPSLLAMESVDVLEPYVVRVNLDSPQAGEWKNRVLMEASSGLGVVSPTAVKKADKEGRDFRDHPVGAGPYQFEEYVENQKVVLSRFADYWAPERQPVAGYEFIQTANGAPRVSSLAAGSLDMAGIAATDIRAVEGRGLDVSSHPSLYTMGIQFCTTKAPFDSLQARQGVVHSLDPEEINDVTFAGQGNLTQLPVPADSPYAEPELASRYDFDTKAGIDLLREAGVAPGTTVTLATDSREPIYMATAEVIQSQLEEVGLSVEIKPYQDPLTLKEVRPDIAVFRTTWPLHSAMMPGAPLNFCNWENAEFTKNFPITRSVTSDEEVIAGAYAAALQALSDDLPTWWFFDVPQFLAHSDKVSAADSYMLKLSGFGQPAMPTFELTD